MNEAKSVALDRIQLGRYEIIVSMQKNEEAETDPYEVKLHPVGEELTMEDMYVLDRYLVAEGYKETWDELVLHLNTGEELPNSNLVSMLLDKLN